jgi:hypothetical protein
MLAPTYNPRGANVHSPASNRISDKTADPTTATAATVTAPINPKERPAPNAPISSEDHNGLENKPEEVIRRSPKITSIAAMPQLRFCVFVT